MAQVNYYEIAKQLDEIKEAVILFYGNAIKKEKDFQKAKLIELRRKSLLDTIEQINKDYKRIALFGGIENLIQQASLVKQASLFPDDTGNDEPLFTNTKKI